jgi:beta-lactamase superfamily II metal-dependent hydrolase
MMTIDIHDVGHGACSVITFPNGIRYMFDCGYGRDANWYPSVHYSGGTINLLALTNLDEDHVDDLPRVWGTVRLEAFFSNPTITADALAAMKAQHGMNAGVRHVHSMLQQYGSQYGSYPDLGECLHGLLE